MGSWQRGYGDEAARLAPAGVFRERAGVARRVNGVGDEVAGAVDGSAVGPRDGHAPGHALHARRVVSAVETGGQAYGRSAGW